MERAGRQPLVLQTDEGSEFIGRHFQAILQHMGIRHFYTHQSTKAAIVERSIRTLMSKMWQAMDHRGHHKWIDLLPKAVQGYNNHVHRSIGIEPNKVTVENARDVWRYLFKKEKENPVPSHQEIISNADLIQVKKKKKATKKKKPAFQVGDRVWVMDKRLNKNAFEKGYKSKWRTEDVYWVTKVLDKEEPKTYRLKNSENQIVPGQFYEDQLQKVPQEE